MAARGKLSLQYYGVINDNDPLKFQTTIFIKQKLHKKAVEWTYEEVFDPQVKYSLIQITTNIIGKNCDTNFPVTIFSA